MLIRCRAKKLPLNLAVTIFRSLGSLAYPNLSAFVQRFSLWVAAKLPWIRAAGVRCNRSHPPGGLQAKFVVRLTKP